MSTKHVNISLRINAETHEALTTIAADLDSTISYVARRAIFEYVRRHASGHTAGQSTASAGHTPKHTAAQKDVLSGDDWTN